jgi:hypothetical protein
VAHPGLDIFLKEPKVSAALLALPLQLIHDARFNEICQKKAASLARVLMQPEP